MDHDKTPMADAVARAEFAVRLADRLLQFPLTPPPGGDHNQHAECLRVAYAGEIVAALNEEVASGKRT
jgi:hypothetical protein